MMQRRRSKGYPFAVALSEVAIAAIDAERAKFIPGLPRFVRSAVSEAMGNSKLQAEKVGMGIGGYNTEGVIARVDQAAQAGIAKIQRNVNKPEFTDEMINSTYKTMELVRRNPYSTPTDLERAQRIFDDAVKIALDLGRTEDEILFAVKRSKE